LLARELSYYPEQTYEPKKKIRKTKRKVHKKNTDNIFKYAALIVALVVLAISILILSRYANITAIRQEITQLEREKLELEKVKMNLIADLEGIKSSVKIEEDAINKLGMNYPTEEQIVYVSIGEDIIERAGGTDRGARFRNIFSIFSKFL